MKNKETRSTGGTTTKGKAEQIDSGVGSVHSSEDTVPDLWWTGKYAEERRDATCSTGSKRREGCGDGLRGLTAPDKVRQLQITLYRKAKSKPQYRFWSLYGEIQRIDVLEAAWRRVKANGGAAGIDGVRVEDLTKDREWLTRIKQELRNKTYRPMPVRRVEIPKANGSKRGLGIPTIKDRVVQMATYLVLMPIFEADFHPHSYGFRPKKGAQQAVEEIRATLRKGKTEVIDADLAKYFDTIPHQKLMRQVARRVSDGEVLKLLKAWLRAPVLEQNQEGCSIKANRCGTPQGGVISPLLANLYLHPLDEAVNERCRDRRGSQPTMIRYADDLVIFCRPGQASGIKERLSRWLQRNGLTLNEEKTRVINSYETGVDFLGYNFRWQKSRKAKNYVHIEPSAAAEQRLRNRLREITQRSMTLKAACEVVAEINEITVGWGNYFALGHYHRSFGQMNHFMAQRLRQWLRCKHRKKWGKYHCWPNHTLFSEYGLYRLPTDFA
ncbi:MAG: group II intron reverse transcriptase/maturase [Verrucomicrobia bacterium]|nr:group II intron reverse transcriptase/maturase [Verrucomicrobiota bacterium]MBV9645811.1 group II intron reverse transcriptase/maturase [Verrucomicrobiota bacterium]